jgi:carboxypeptidase A2
LEIVPKTQEHLQFLIKLLHGPEHVDFWVEPSTVGSPVTVMLSPTQFRKVKVMLIKEGLGFERVNTNVQSMLDPMWKAIDQRKQSKEGLVFNLDDFNTIEDINAWLATTAANCPSTLTCRVYSVGDSALGQPINVFHISKSGSGRKAYWVDATIHAREWIATATALRVLDNLATLGDANAVRLTDSYDWYILPVMNPDGYAYTWSNDRLWRKNRRQNTGSACFGTDLNRNFDFRWGTEGVSHQPCGDTYCGPSGGSEPETQAVQTELRRLGPSLLATVTVHAYGNMWMFPWGNTVNHAGQTCERAADHDELMRVSDATANAIENTYNTKWARGNSCEVIYTTTGGTDDYSKGGAGVKYAFCPELRGTSFVVNANQILPSYNEFFNGIVAMVDSING